jgi:hypothetical protein
MRSGCSLELPGEAVREVFSYLWCVGGVCGIEVLKIFIGLAVRWFHGSIGHRCIIPHLCSCRIHIDSSAGSSAIDSSVW